MLFRSENPASSAVFRILENRQAEIRFFKKKDL
jgi:hypothetical protein